MRAERPVTAGTDVSHNGALAGAPRAKWREVVAGGLYYSGVLRMLQSVSRRFELRSHTAGRLPQWRRVSGPKFPILCYHRIGTGGIPLFNGVPPEVFEAQMRYLRQRYRIVSLGELCRELQDPSGVGQAVAVTFDDGYRDLYTHAYPVLQKYRVPATIFLAVNAIETGQVPWYDRVFLALKVFPGEQLDLVLDRPRHFALTTQMARLQAAAQIVQHLRRLPDGRRRECCAELEKRVALPQEELAERMLTWGQVRTMHRAGIAFGSHTLSHPVVSRLAPAEVERELRESKQILEDRLGTPVRDFAYPFGQPADCGSEAIATLTRCGYRSAATTVEGVNTRGTDMFGLRRVQIGEERSLPMFAFKLNELFLRAENEINSKSSGARFSAENEVLDRSGTLAS